VCVVVNACLKKGWKTEFGFDETKLDFPAFLDPGVHQLSVSFTEITNCALGNVL
jgi:hypothetical protein